MLPIYAKKNIQVSLTSLSVIMSYQLKDYYTAFLPIPPIVVAGISAIVTACASPLITNEIFEFKWMRKIIISRTWIEGYWQGSTLDENGQKTLVIIQFYYIEEQLDLRINAIHVNNKYEEISSLSRFIKLEDLNYVNHFEHILVDGKSLDGVAVGKFSTNNKYPNKYTGRLFLENKEDFLICKMYKQELKKMQDSLATKYVNKYGDDWEENYLKEELKKKQSLEEEKTTLPKGLNKKNRKQPIFGLLRALISNRTAGS
jgi:hypothetical protein